MATMADQLGSLETDWRFQLLSAAGEPLERLATVKEILNLYGHLSLGPREVEALSPRKKVCQSADQTRLTSR